MRKRRDSEQEKIVTEALYYAAVAGYYDTRVEEKKPRVTFTELRELPAGATHSFAILVDQTGYQVTRYPDNWAIGADDKTESQQRERLLREGALDTALHHFTRGDYTIGSGDEARGECIEKLLLKQNAGEPLSHWSKLGRHPIVKDAPDGDSLRRWSVLIGPHCCSVALVNDSATPEFAILP